MFTQFFHAFACRLYLDFMVILLQNVEFQKHALLESIALVVFQYFHYVCYFIRTNTQFDLNSYHHICCCLQIEFIKKGFQFFDKSRSFLRVYSRLRKIESTIIGSFRNKFKTRSDSQPWLHIQIEFLNRA